MVKVKTTPQDYWDARKQHVIHHLICWLIAVMQKKEIQEHILNNLYFYFVILLFWCGGGYTFLVTYLSPHIVALTRIICFFLFFFFVESSSSNVCQHRFSGWQNTIFWLFLYFRRKIKTNTKQFFFVVHLRQFYLVYFYIYKVVFIIKPKLQNKKENTKIYIYIKLSQPKNNKYRKKWQKKMFIYDEEKMNSFQK